MSFVALLLRFALFGYVRDMQIFQVLFWVDLVLWVWYMWVSYLARHHIIATHKLAYLESQWLQSAITSLNNIWVSIKNVILNNKSAIYRYVFPLSCLWLLWIVITMVISHYIPSTLRLALLLWWRSGYVSRDQIQQKWLYLGEIAIKGYELSVIVWVVCWFLAMQRYFFVDSPWMVFASVLWAWLVYLIWSYLSGIHMSDLSKYFSFWCMTGIVMLTFLRQWWVMLFDWFDDRIVQRVVYQEKIIYVPAEIDDYTSIPVDTSPDWSPTTTDSQLDVLDQAWLSSILDTRDTWSGPLNVRWDVSILDSIDTDDGDSIAQRVLQAVE